MRISESNWSGIEAYLRDDDRAVVPLGSTEQHAGLSLCVDAILAERVAVEAAEPLGVPVFPALPDTVDHFGGFLNIGPTIEYVERAFDAAKYGWYSEQPFIDAAIQSVIDPDMAPPGKHVMSCFVQYAPYELRGSDWETERQAFGDKAQAVLESHFPGFGDLVLHREVVTPVDIETRTGLTEGNIFAGEFLAPQMYFFRPAPGWSQYATPIDGYYQCGSGTHPGGCVIGSPGKLASRRILSDLKR